MVTETFGDMLFCPESECLDEFPSPEEMKYRIIISTKPPKEYLQSEAVLGTEDQSSKKQRNSNENLVKTEPLKADHDQEENDTVHKESSL